MIQTAVASGVLYPDSDGKPMADNTKQLGITFDMFDDGLAVFYPNGERFKDPEELFQERNQARRSLDQALAKLRELGIEPDESAE